MRKNKILQNLSYSVLANGTSTLVSMILVLFVPKIVGVREYSYWQLFLFYASYVGFFHFGWADGVYLRFGGKKYNDLDKEYFHTQFWLLTILEIILGTAIAVSAILFVPDIDKKYVFIAVGICCVLQIPRTFLQYVLQATDKIVNYAKNFLWEKILYAVLVVVFLLLGFRDFRVLVLADLIARGFTLILLANECRDIVFKKVSFIRTGLQDAWTNISVGIKLMFGNIASNLLLGIVRWAIQNYWSVETFGRVSLSITASNLLMTFIGAVSIVIYPMLKNVNEKEYPAVYTKMRNSLMIPVLGLLVVYYPAKVILSWWLPQYAESLKYMALLFPMCVFESKMVMLINTYLKALREEKKIMFINWCAVVITLISTGILVYGLNNLTLTILSLTCLMGVRCCIGEIMLSKIIRINIWKDIIVEWVLIFVFIISGWLMNSFMVTVIYATAYFLYLFWKREPVKQIIEMVRASLKKEKG